MRILRIAGQNLASLLDFELDFQQTPLAEAGLFAITGPTGAGKSTLLDALCLALYNRTPRMASAQTNAKVADLDATDDKQELISANDVRLLLRRGAAKGLAEVDFLAIDGGRYRSRWSVTRAYGKPDGRLQHATMMLSRLGPDGETPECSGRGEVTQRVTTLLGLNFDQFCRAVVLAQGDFAAFLRAKPEERAELLERMTDTGIYGEISRQAHAESAWWRAQTQSLSQARSLLTLPPPGERATLQARLDALTAEIAAAEVDAETARTIGQWHERATALADEQTEADDRHRRAKAALIELEPAIDDLRQVEDAQALEPLWRQHLREEAHVAYVTAELVRLQAGQVDAEAASQRAGAQVTELTHVVATVEEARQAAQPEMRQARELDTRLEVAQADLAAERQRADEAEQQWRGKLKEVGQLDRDLAQRRDTLSTLQGWLDQHADSGWLAAGWAPVEVRLAQAVELAARRQEVDDALTDAQAKHQVARDALQSAAQTWYEAQQRASEATASAEQARQEAAAADQGDPVGRCEAAQRQRQRLQDASELLKAEHEALAAAQTLQLAVVHHMREAELAAALEGEARADIERGRVQLAEARHALRLMQAELDVGELRPLLQAGQPCPLCGSVEHPWATQAPSPPLVARQQQRIEEVELALTSAQTKAAEGMAAARTATAAAERARHDLSELVQAGTVRQERWSLLVPDAPHLAGPEAEAWTTAQLAAAEESLAAALAAVASRDARQAAARACADAAWRAQLEAEQSHGRHELATQRMREAVHALQVAEAAQSGWQAALAGVRTALDAHWQRQPAWLVTFETDPAQLQSMWSSEVALWQRQHAEATVCGAAVTAAAGILAVATAACDGLAQRWQEMCRQLATAAATVDQLLAARAGLCAGGAVDAFEAGLQAAVDRAAAARSAAHEMQEAAHARLVELTAMLAAAEVAHGKTIGEAASVRRELLAALTNAGLTEAELVERLARPAEELARQQQQVDGARKAVAHAEGVLADLAERRAEHAASTPEESAAAAAIRLDQAEQRAATARDHRGQTWQQLQQHDELEQQQRALADRLAQLQALATPWMALDDLLGSADGKKFRNYAQGLTFDALIGHANGYLANLARRYRLQRVPGAHLDLQVRDLDMGGEVRAITTLSGGEGFLVSLALALGLSSLSSRAQTIGTLFIDEGFGTLDGDTLETAIAVLDGLQAAGRQVGIISHVAGLAERIGVQVQVRPQGAGRSKVSLVRG